MAMVSSERPPPTSLLPPCPKTLSWAGGQAELLKILKPDKVAEFLAEFDESPRGGQASWEEVTKFLVAQSDKRQKRV